MKTIPLPVVLYECNIWTFILTEEHRFMVFENRVLRRIFGLTGEKKQGKWRKLHNELNFYFLCNIMRTIKARSMRCPRLVARMGRRGRYKKLYSQKLKERNCLGHTGFDGRLILQRIE
jgi:hypothetical protein